jgi:lipopolysaccharide export system protein LptC
MAESAPFTSLQNGRNGGPGGNAAAPRRRVGWSRTVGLLKILLPTLALSLVILVILWAQSRNGDDGFHIGFSTLQPGDALKLSMVNARYAGMSRSSQPYLVTAATATQDSPSADVIHLDAPKGDITLKGGAWVALSAPKGDYRQSTQMLDLRDGVTLFHDSGLEFNTATAGINLKESTALGIDPVTGHGPASEISSAGFRVLDGGQRIIFTGKAHLTLYRKAPTPAKRTRPDTKAKGGNKR